MHTRMGKFIINNTMIEDTCYHQILMKLMGRMIITRAEQRYDRHGFEYYAMSEYFDPVEEGMVIPEYRFIIEGDIIRCELIK